MLLLRAFLIIFAAFLATSQAKAANCIQAGGYPYTTNQCINAGDLNSAFELSISPGPPANLYGQGALKGKPWLDTSTSPATLRMCANPTGYCQTRFVASDWITEGAIDFTAMAPNWPIGGGSATLVANTLTDLSQTPAAFVTISGSANISSFGSRPAGQIKLLYFTGNATLVSGTAIITPGGQTMTTQPGYEAFAVSQTPGVWIIIPVGSIGAGFHSAVNLATAAALPAETYSNGSSGVGATLTENANGALVVDGVPATTGMRILDKNEATAAWNGIYNVTNAGSSSAQYVLTRSADFNTASTGNISNGAVVPVSSGNTLANTSWVLTTTGTITVGTTPLTFGPYAQPNVYTAGTGLQLTGNQFSLNASFANLTGQVALPQMPPLPNGDVYYGNGSNQATPTAFNSLLTAPPPIGTTTPNTASFSTMLAGSATANPIPSYDYNVLGSTSVINSGTYINNNGIGVFLANNLPSVGPGLSQNSVLFYGSGYSNVNNAWTWGLNPVLTDIAGITGAALNNEFDFNVYNASTTVYGLLLQGASLAQPTGVHPAIEVAPLDVQNNPSHISWAYGLQTLPAAAAVGAYFGALTAGTTPVGSQPVEFGYVNPAGTPLTFTMEVSPAGNLTIIPTNQAGAAVGVNIQNNGSPVVNTEAELLETTISGQAQFAEQEIGTNVARTVINNTGAGGVQIVTGSGGLLINTAQAASCVGTPTTSFTVTNGIVTHC